MGVTGVVYDGIPYIYDKEALTKCGGMYDSVFEIKKDNGVQFKFISKCFLSENIIKGMFLERASEKIYVQDIMEYLTTIN